MTSNLVEHARRELEIIGEDKDTIEGFIRIVQAFADMGHSGGSASIAIPMITSLLHFQNLSYLTDNPDEWQFHAEEMAGVAGGFWQNRRNGEAFSLDGGKTYYLLSEGGNANNPKPLHNSRMAKPCNHCGTSWLHTHSQRCPDHVD